MKLSSNDLIINIESENHSDNDFHEHGANDNLAKRFLNDIWVFDTWFETWHEIKAPFKI
jgi:hypothetical protein